MGEQCSEELQQYMQFVEQLEVAQANLQCAIVSSISLSRPTGDVILRAEATRKVDQARLVLEELEERRKTIWSGMEIPQYQAL